MDQVAILTQERGRLWSLAHRMLGSTADADDVLQEAYLRWHGARAEEIRSPQAWLVATTRRLCIDRLRQLRAERERYRRSWLPEPSVAEAPPPTNEAIPVASDLSIALLTVLERLAPEERAAFLLREGFEAEYGDIARILSKSEAACRQIVSRARKRVRSRQPRVHVSIAAKKRLLDALLCAVRAGDEDALVALLLSPTGSRLRLVS